MCYFTVKAATNIFEKGSYEESVNTSDLLVTCINHNL